MQQTELDQARAALETAQRQAQALPKLADKVKALEAASAQSQSQDALQAAQNELLAQFRALAETFNAHGAAMLQQWAEIQTLAEQLNNNAVKLSGGRIRTMCYLPAPPDALPKLIERENRFELQLWQSLRQDPWVRSNFNDEYQQITNLMKQD